MRTFARLACTALFLLALTPHSAAQDGELRLDLAAANVRPDVPVFVNVMLSNTVSAQLYTVRESILFPSDKLLFSKAQLGIAADLAHADLKLEMKDKSGAKVDSKKAAQRIDLTITAKNALPDGPLVELEFQLLDHKEGSIALKHTAEALDEQGKKLADLQAPDGEVVVKSDVGDGPKPIMTCFFFSH